MKVPTILLEVQNVEQVGMCYQIRCVDIQGGSLDSDTIDCTFHSDCKPKMQKEVRKGCVLFLENVAVYCLGMQPNKSNLIVMDKCIKKVIKL